MSVPSAPVVFVEKVKSALRLAAVDREAGRQGLIPGLTLADARARIPELCVADMDRPADAASLARIADACDRYTPLVEIEAPEMLFLDITGCAHLFGGEAGLCRDLATRLKGAGFEARISLAGTPHAARALARSGRQVIVPPGEEAEAVAGVPIEALDLAPGTLTTLTRAGLKTIGDLARQPRPSLAARFGTETVSRLIRTLGQEDTAITPRRALPDLTVERRFAEPVGRTDDAFAALAGLCRDMADLLEARGEGGRHFEATFFRTDGTVFRLCVETGRPARDPALVMRLFNERLGALADPLDPGFGFDLVRLAVRFADRVEARQHSLDANDLEDEAVATLTDRLAARFGVARVQRLAPVDSHIPERAARALAVHAAQREPQRLSWDHAEEDADEDAPPVRPIHLFAAPQPIEALAEVPDGPPLKFRWRRVLHEIARAEGPERIAPEWWLTGEGAPTRDYYRVEDSRGCRFWVFREGLFHEEEARPRWFLHGVFA
ncbi:Y-family DNA polymerase [Hartmannibacter diazotrophicus]|nr:DNA polymerase Y family protein [Hartmannibacter diazotrophicus]